MCQASSEINTRKSFSSQRPWCGLRITIRTRQPNVPPLDQLSVGNPARAIHIQGITFATNRMSRATRSGYVTKIELRHPKGARTVHEPVHADWSTLLRDTHAGARRRHPARSGKAWSRPLADDADYTHVICRLFITRSSIDWRRSAFSRETPLASSTLVYGFLSDSWSMTHESECTDK
jgi:hypothetical protein